MSDFDEGGVNRFWAGGCAEAERALTGRYEAVFEDLRTRLAAATGEAEMAELKRALSEAEAEYQRKLESLERSLF